MTNSFYAIHYLNGNVSNGKELVIEKNIFSSIEDADAFLTEKGFEATDYTPYKKGVPIPHNSIVAEVGAEPIWKTSDTPELILKEYQRKFEHTLLFGGTTTFIDTARILKHELFQNTP